MKKVKKSILPPVHSKWTTSDISSCSEHRAVLWDLDFLSSLLHTVTFENVTRVVKPEMNI